MKRFTVYTSTNCNWCIKAKRLLQDYNFDYDEKKLNEDYTREELRVVVPEHLPLTVPQVFIGNHRIGGYEDLADYLESTGIMGTQQ